MRQDCLASPFRTGFTHRRVMAVLIVAALSANILSCGKSSDAPGAQVKAESPIIGESPLAKATVQGDITEIKALIDGGADVNAKDALGRTPLHIAAFYGHTKTSDYLISRGAEINAKDRVGMTPLHVAVISGGRQEVELLLDKNADISIKSDSGQTA